MLHTFAFAGVKQCASKVPASPTSSLLSASLAGVHPSDSQVQTVQDSASSGRGVQPLEPQVQPKLDSAPGVGGKQQQSIPDCVQKISCHPSANSQHLVHPPPVINPLLGLPPPGLPPTAIPPPALPHQTLLPPSVPPHRGPHQRVVR